MASAPASVVLLHLALLVFVSNSSRSSGGDSTSCANGQKQTHPYLISGYAENGESCCAVGWLPQKPASRKQLVRSKNSKSEMASTSAFVFLVLLFAAELASASDPDPVLDFCIPSKQGYYSCKPYSEVSSKDFYSTVLRINQGDPSANPDFNFSQAIVDTFPALNTMGLSMNRVYMRPNGVLRAHSHPRGNELVYVESGSVEVGFVDTKNRLFAHRLEKSDIFVIPSGLLHYFFNVGNRKATVLAILNSQNPSFQIPSFALFGPKLPDQVLQASFLLNKTEVDALQKIYSKLV